MIRLLLSRSSYCKRALANDHTIRVLLFVRKIKYTKYWTPFFSLMTYASIALLR